MAAFIFAVIVIALLALAVFGIVDEAQRKKRLKENLAVYEAKIRKIHEQDSHGSADYSDRPLKVFDYGIDMNNMQAQVQAAEKSMYQSMQKQQQASAINDQWLQLQKIAYTMVGPSVTAEEKQRFNQQMTEFAKEDPLYNEVMARLIPLVQANPGITQSKLYKGEPDHIKEQMRYVLYFASELGHIRRVKKGNSYELYPPNMV